MKKLLLPSTENREACLNQLWDKLYTDGHNENSILEDFQRMKRHVDGESLKATLASLDVASLYFKLAMIARRKGEQQGANRYLHRSFAFIYWARELDILARQAPDWPELEGDDLLMPLLTWQALATVCGSSWFTLWLAPHLHNQFGYPQAGMVVMHYSRDMPARRFMELLQRCLITGVWPDRIDVDNLSAYGKLLQACTQPDAWNDALMEFCDWRIANAYGYAEMGASKRRRQSQMASVLDVERIEQVFPVELLTLKFAFERATGKTLSLDSPHPLLQSTMMTLPFPNVEPMYEDEWTNKLAALREKFAKGLPLRAPVVAKYV